MSLHLLFSMARSVAKSKLWTAGLLAATATIPGIGTSLAHAQTCDPVETAKLLASDGAAFDNFGYSVAVNGDTAIIGARWNNDNGPNSGSAYVFIRSGSVWTQQAKLLPGDGAEDDEFGYSVSISGDTAIIGAYLDDDNGNNSGSAYVFTRTGGIWTLQAKLLPDDGEEEERFGYSVSIDGDKAVVGAIWDDDIDNRAGSAYIFSRSGGVWTQQAKLLPADGARSDFFGEAVSIDGNSAVIGAWGNNDNGPNSGSVYVFTRTGGVWVEQAKLLPDDGFSYDSFGESAVSISGDTIIAGARGDNPFGSNSGSAYIFTRASGIWTQQAKLLPDDGESLDEFGSTVSISGDFAVIAAIGDEDFGENTGSSYIFSRAGGIWTQQAKLLPGDEVGGNFFGKSVSISSDSVVVGVYRDDDFGTYSGSAYVFDLGCTSPCPADLNSDGLLDFFDLQEFLNWYSAGDLQADFIADGVLDFFDVQEYLNLYSAGCP